MAEATVGRVGIRVFPDLKDFRENLKTQLAAIAKTTQINIPAKLDVDKSAINVGDNVTRQAGHRAGRSFGDAFRGALAFELAERTLKGALAPLEAIGKFTGFGVLAVQAAAATQAVVAFGAALAPAVGILAAVPAGALVAGAAMGTLAVALSGVSAAFKAGLSGDAADFEKAISGLAPSAQVVAKEFQALAPALRDIRTTVQESFFAPLQGQIMAIAATLSGTFKQGMTDAAGALGQATAEVARFSQQAQTVDLIAATFSTLQASVTSLTPAIEPVLAGFRDIAAVGLPTIGSLADTVSVLAQRFGLFLSEAAASGQALAWIENAKTVFRALGDLAQSVGGILASVFRAASSAAGEFASPLGVLGNALAKVNEYLRSAPGQTALTEIFRTLGTVGSSLGQILQSILAGLGRIAPYLGQIAEMAGPALARMFDALGKGLAALGPGLVEVFAQLAESGKLMVPVFIEAGKALGELLTAAAPLIVPLSQLATGAILPLIKLVGQLAVALQPVTQQLAEQLAPVIPELARALSGFVEAVLPILPPLAELAISLIPFVVNGFKTLTVILELLTPLIERAAVTIKVWAGAFTFIAETISGFINLVQSLTGKIGEALAPLGSLIAGLFTSAWTGAVTIVTGAARAIAGYALQLVRWIMEALSPLYEGLASMFTGIWSRVSSIFTDGVNTAVNTARNIVNAVVGAVSGLIGAIASWAASVWASARSGFESGVSNVVGVARSIPGAILGVISGLGSSLFRAGAEIISRLADGIRSAIGAVRDAIGSVAGAIGRFLPGSPVKEGPLKVLNNGYAGGQIVKMVTEGMTRQQNLVAATTSSLAGLIAGSLAVGSDGVVGAGAYSSVPLEIRNELFLDGDRVYDNQQLVAGRRGFRG